MDKAKTVAINTTIRDYTNRVLGVIKEKYGLRDKGEALDRFADLYGDEFVDREVREEIVNEVIERTKAHIKKYGYRSTTIAQLRKELESG